MVREQAQIRVITHETQIEEIQVEWIRLLSGAADYLQLFLHPEHLRHWWTHRRTDRDSLWILLCHVEGRLVGLAPFLITWWYRGAPGTCLRLMGDDQSDYLDMLAEVGYEEAVVNAIAAAIEREKEIAWLRFAPLAEASLIARLVRALQNWNARTQLLTICPVLRRNVAFSRARQKELDYYRRKASGRGELALKRAQTNEETARAVEALFHLHVARWSQTNTPSKFRFEKFRHYYRELAHRLLPTGALHLSILYLDAEPIAAHLGFITPQALQFYTPAFSVAHKDLSPGLLLMGALIEQAWEMGRTEFDFLRGDEPYKLKWTQEFRQLVVVSAERRSMRGWMVYYYVEGVRPCLKAIRRFVLKGLTWGR